MIVSIAEFLILGFIVEWAFRKLTIPGLVGLLFLGVVLGPFVLDLATPELLRVSDELRLIALIVILLRAGLELSKETLNRVGGRVLLLATVPAVFEGAAITALGQIGGKQSTAALKELAGGQLHPARGLVAARIRRC